jgi:predicted metal-dependent phosphoesterase TrpH
MIDLHTHTNRSDGSVAPEQLVHDAKAIGLQALGITDHDTLDGYDIAAPAAAAAGLELVCGIELSTRADPPPGGGRAPSVHLLGYFLQDPASAGFRQWIKGHQDSRRESQTDSLGVEITLEEVQVLGKHLTGRPHFAKILLKKSYVKTNQEAFDKYLADSASASVEREEPELAGAGGVSQRAFAGRHCAV